MPRRSEELDDGAGRGFVVRERAALDLQEGDTCTMSWSFVELAVDVRQSWLDLAWRIR
jgi:hypothetical protein